MNDKRKKLILLIGIPVLILAAVLAGLLIFGRGKPVPADDEDCRFGYTFTQNGDRIVVNITGGEEGYVWSASESDPFGILSVGEPRAKKNGTSFTVTGSAAAVPSEVSRTGRVDFLLSREGVLPDIAYVISAVFRFDVEGGFGVDVSYHRELSGCVSQADAEIPFAWAGTPEGTAELLLLSDGGEGWSAFTSDEGVAVIALSESGGARYTVSPVSAGSARVTVSHEETKRGLTLDVTVRADKTVTIEGFSVADFDREAEVRKQQAEERGNAVAEAVGTLTLPAGAVYADSNTMIFFDAAGEIVVGAWVDFEIDGITWTYTAAAGVPVSSVCTYYEVTGDGTKDKVGDAEARCYTTAEGCLVIWSGGNGDAFSLLGGSDMSAALRCAAALYALNPAAGTDAG